MKAYCNKKLQIFRTSETGNNNNFISTVLINNIGETILVPTNNNNMIEVRNKRKVREYNYQSISENFELIFHSNSKIHPITSSNIDCIYSIDNIEEIKFEAANGDFTFEKLLDNSIYFILSNFDTKGTIPHKKLLNLRKAIS